MHSAKLMEVKRKRFVVCSYCENARNLLKSRVDSSGTAQEFPHGSRRADVNEASGE
tara:strand:- start:222 stop:389 length:168 start_codon:yes stop_codon:yes gene_type:complete